jgi:hypothetical protein
MAIRIEARCGVEERGVAEVRSEPNGRLIKKSRSSSELAVVLVDRVLIEGVVDILWRPILASTQNPYPLARLNLILQVSAILLDRLRRVVCVERGRCDGDAIDGIVEIDGRLFTRVVIA